MKVLENNRAVVCGKIIEPFAYNHEMYGEKFYTSKLAASRKSGAVDELPIMVSDRLVDMSVDFVGKFVQIFGEFRSFNEWLGDEKSKLILNLFVKKMVVVDKPFDANTISIVGAVCRKPIYRKTPLGREIADMLIAVNRSYGKSDYIPCICWGRNARYAGELEVGDRLRAVGRIQSRGYIKKIGENEAERRVAYEVSVSQMDKIEEEGGDE